MDPTVRAEQESDQAVIREVTIAAFGRRDEADIIDRLRSSRAFLPELSLVAEIEGAVVGHVISSLAEAPGLRALALGPISVVPARQRLGIGSALMEATIRRAREMRYDVIVLIGHPTYYPRFGFVPVSRLGLDLGFKVPDDVAMALPLREIEAREDVLRIRFPDAFPQP